MVGFGMAPIRVVTEFDRVISIRPLDYAHQYIGLTRPSTRMDSDVDSDTESASELLAVGMSRGQPLPRGFPNIVCVVQWSVRVHWGYHTTAKA